MQMTENYNNLIEKHRKEVEEFPIAYAWIVWPILAVVVLIFMVVKILESLGKKIQKWYRERKE